MRLAIWLALGALATMRIVYAADPQPYEVHISPTHNGALDAALRASSQLVSLRTTAPVGPFALVDRAQQDIARLRDALDSFGYYRARITLSINGHALADPGLPNILAALPKKPPARVEVAIDTGPLFHLRFVTVEGEVSRGALAAFGLKSGAPAVAADVLAARDRLLTALQAQGHAFATVSEPIAYENATLPVLDVTFMADAGPSYVLGPISFQGLKTMHEDFVRRQLLIHPGELYNPARIERARTSLLALGVFASVTVPPPQKTQARDGQVPLTFVFVESKRHAVSLNAEYSSDLGVIAGASWTNRNLFGNAEQLTLKADVFDLGGTASVGAGYDLGATLIKPDFLRTDQSLQLSLLGLKQDLVAYDQVSGTGGATVTRKLSSVWNVGAGLSLEVEKIQQTEVVEDGQTGECTLMYNMPASWCHYTLLALPLSARYDSTDLPNPLLDPTHGERATLLLTPTESLFTRHATFLIMQISGSYYFDFAKLGWNAPGRSVLAMRALVGDARGASQFSLPPDQRFYAGGSATVRGYAYQSLGPTFPPTSSIPAGEYPEGGTGLAAATIELRQRLWGNWGMTAFVDVGEATTNPDPLDPKPPPPPKSNGTNVSNGYTGPNAYSFGYGAGPLYYTPIGPIRFSVAFPAKVLPNGDRFEAYIGLGQAF